MCPLPPSPAGGHGLHAGPSGGLGRSGEPFQAAACQTLCGRCGLWLGYGLLPVQSGGEAVGDLGLSAGPAAHATERETQQGLWWTLDGRLETLGLLELSEWGKCVECVYNTEIPCCHFIVCIFSLSVSVFMCNFCVCCLSLKKKTRKYWNR